MQNVTFDVWLIRLGIKEAKKAENEKFFKSVFYVSCKSNI